jgi:thymidylate synthase (FAD)
MFVKLIAWTNEGETIPAIAGKLCYSNDGYEGIVAKLDRDKTGEFIRKITGLGHHSVIEHISFTFMVEGVSRALTHQLVRHRLASYSQKSQRYVNESAFEYITPHSIENAPAVKAEYTALMKQLAAYYDTLIKAGIPKEDARYILPNAAETKIMVTMNARELLHYFEKRLCNRAQWEIREMSDLMLAEVKKVSPNIFSSAGPGCVSGQCPEGKMTCGKMQEVREKYLGK